MPNSIKIIPSINWPLRQTPLNGNEHLLKQNPITDQSPGPKEERISVSSILDYILLNIPATSPQPPGSSSLSLSPPSNTIQSINGQATIIVDFFTDTDMTDVTITFSKSNSNPITLRLIQNSTAQNVDFNLPNTASTSTTANFTIPQGTNFTSGQYTLAVIGDDLLQIDQILIN